MGIELCVGVGTWVWKGDVLAQDWLGEDFWRIVGEASWASWSRMGNTS